MKLNCPNQDFKIKIKEILRKAVAVFLVVSMIMGLSAPMLLMPTSVMAAGGNVRIKSFVERDAGGDLILRLDWSSDTFFDRATVHAKLTWIDRNNAGVPVLKTFDYIEPVVDAGSGTTSYREIKKAVIPINNNFSNGILYQFKVEFYSTEDDTAQIAGFFGESAFLRGIQLQAGNVTSAAMRSMNAGTVKESGYKPALEVIWIMPRVYVNPGPADPYILGGSFERIFTESGDASDTGYQAALAAIQTVDASISQFTLLIGLKNYIFSQNRELACQNIQIAKSWSGPDCLLEATVDFTETKKYRAQVEKVDPASPDDDRFRIYLLGRQDAALPFPDDTDWDILTNPQVEEQFIPKEIADSANPAKFGYILRHEDVYPGSVYNIHAELKHINNSGIEIIETDGFRIIANKYLARASTSMRILVSKVSEEFVKVDVYRINRGMDYLAGNVYRVQLRMDGQTTLEPVTEVKVSDINDMRETLQAYVRVTSPIVTYYYTAYYTDANLVNLLSSMNIPYVLSIAGSDVPLTPRGVVIEELIYNPETKTTDVTVSWDKPDDWEAMNLVNTFIEFDLNTSYLISENAQTFYGEDGTAIGKFMQQYKTILAVRGTEIQKSVTNDRLFYTISGSPGSLFRVIAEDTSLPGTDAEAAYPADYWAEQRTKTAVNGQDLYPDFLLPNTRYFLTLRTVNRTTDAASVIGRVESNPSISIGFTTYPTEYTVPLPFEFRVTGNTITPTPTGTAAFENSVGLQNSAIDLDYTGSYISAKQVFYELYISDNPLDPKPQLAGITNNIAVKTWEDPVWGAKMRLPRHTDGQLAAKLISGTTTTTAQGTYINWNDLKLYDGQPLQPNKIYYFWMRTYIIEKDAAGVDKIIGDVMHSIMLSLTTRPYPQIPDDTYRRLRSPTDFAIARDKEGNLLVTGETAVFEWSPTGEEVLYELVATSIRDFNWFMNPDTGLPFGDPALADSGTDLTYDSFVRAFDADDGVVDGRLLLDPTRQDERFSFDPLTGKYSFTMDHWLFPNSLYYISIRPVKRDGVKNETFYKTINNTGAYMTVPLTTLLLEAPFDLRTVTGAELCFSFEDSEPGYLSTDYHIYIFRPGEADYTLSGGSRGTILRAGNAVYGQVRGLEFMKEYDVRVMRGDQTPQLVYEEKGLRTREACFSVEAEWKGLAMEPDDQYLQFQLAIISQREMENLPPEEVEYFELSEVNLAQYVYVADGASYPYYIAENAETVLDPQIMLYRTVIHSKPVRLANGVVEQRPLESNTLYYIKVRTRKLQESDADTSAFSKFAGPVNARTDFVQIAQDDIEEQMRLEQNLLDELAGMEQETIYEIDLGAAAENKLILKEDKIVGILKSSPNASFLIDVSENAKKASTDVIYVPGGVFTALQEFDKSLTIRSEGIEYIFSKNTIDLSYSDTVADLVRRAGTDVLMVRLKSGRTEFLAAYAPEGSRGITDMHTLTADIIASKRSYQNINAIITDYIYNEKTGLLAKKLAALSYHTNVPKTASDLAEPEPEDPLNPEDQERLEQRRIENRLKASNAYLKELIRDLRSGVSYKIGDVLEGRNGYQSIIADIMNVKEFDEPLGIRLNHDVQKAAKVNPFVSFDRREWFKLTQGLTNKKTSIVFEVVSTGTYAAVAAGIATNGLREGSDDRMNVESVAKRVELADIFGGIGTDLKPELPVLNKEAVLVYERILDMDRDTYGMDMTKKTAALGIADIVRPGSLNAQMSRQQAAELIIRMYCAKNGIAGQTVAGSRAYTIVDAGDINAEYRTAVNLCLEKGFMKLSGGKFEPNRAVTRIEFINALSSAIMQQT